MLSIHNLCSIYFKHPPCQPSTLVFSLGWPIIIPKALHLTGQLAYLEEIFNSVFGANLVIKIALSSCPYYNPRWNFWSINLSNNELVNSSLIAPTKSNGFLVPISHIFTPTLILAALPSIKKLFKQFMQICIEKIKDQAPLLSLIKAKEKTLDWFLKIEKPELYFENSNMEYYYFCWQCKDYFKTAKTKDHKRVFLAVLFFRKKINIC